MIDAWSYRYYQAEDLPATGLSCQLRLTKQRHELLMEMSKQGLNRASYTVQVYTPIGLQGRALETA
jgi:hypothetical protein